MSLARITHVKKTRKDWICSKCRKPIPAGSPALNFSVGYRGASQYRHSQAPECFPTREERESSLIAPIYGAIDSAYDFLQTGASSLEEVREALEQVAETIGEVASEYESSEMYDASEDLQERVSTLESAAGELESWEPDVSLEEPDENDRDTWLECLTYTAAKDVFAEQYLEAAIEDATSLLSDLELP